MWRDSKNNLIPPHSGAAWEGSWAELKITLSEHNSLKCEIYADVPALGFAGTRSEIKVMLWYEVGLASEE